MAASSTRRTRWTRAAAVLGSGILITTALTVSTVPATAKTSAATLAGPNSGAAIAARPVGSAKQIAAGGVAHAKFLGTVNMASQPDVTAAAVVKGRGHAALTVPGWFKGPDVGATASKGSKVAPLVTTPTHIRANKAGTASAQSSCGCQPPDTNGAIGTTRIVEAVNLSLTIYTRSGGFVARKSLAGFWPTSREISDPRVIYDFTKKRWILTFIPVPTSTSDTPQLYFAVSTSNDPNGTWFKYTISFSGSLFPLGTLLDYPMSGQDARAVLVGTNNFRLIGTTFNYINSTVFAVPKAAAYAGAGFSFPAFSTAFGTFPSVAKGRGPASYAKSYFLAANSSGGYSLYYMTGTGGTPSFFLQGTSANSLWSPPPRAVQPAPNGAATLDALDGRIQSPPIQADTFLWFTHAVKVSGFPAVRYGAISLSSSGTGGVSVTTANAFKSATSYDWNPSLTLSELSTNSVRIFLNWAVTDPATGQNLSLRVSGVGPGEGVPSLIGIGTNVFTGGGSSINSRFGDYSSTSIDVNNVSSSCTWATQALVVNEVFSSNDWRVRFARVGTC